jgi:hypothetical protein
MSTFRATLLGVAAGVGVIVLQALFASPGASAPTPPTQPVRLSDIVCPAAPRLVRVGRDGRIEVQQLGRDGCVVGWVPWRPMVRGR